MDTEYFPTAGPTMYAFDPWYNELAGERSHHLQRANQTIEANLSAEASPTSVEAFSCFSHHESQDYLRMHRAAHQHPLYQNATRDRGDLFHCPFRVHGKCKHEPQSNRYKFFDALDAHFKPFQCNKGTCQAREFGSIKALRNHDNEFHTRRTSWYCPYPNCLDSMKEFTRKGSLKTHMHRAHGDTGEGRERARAVEARRPDDGDQSPWPTSCKEWVFIREPGMKPAAEFGPSAGEELESITRCTAHDPQSSLELY
ncbi:C2H2 transcription factor [Ilyonectria robusta]